MIRRLSFRTQPEAIVALEQALEKLRNGQVVGISVVFLDADNDVWFHSLWERWLTGVGALYGALALYERDGGED